MKTNFCLFQEQLLLELDMYQDIAVARGTTYDTLNARMDKCQQNIENMSNDIQRLQVNFYFLLGVP